MLLDLSIGQRLTLGFLAAALIATLVASLVGVLRSQALSRQSDFYQHLLQVNTSLTTGANFLQLMNTAVHTHLDTADATAPSQESLSQQRKAIQDLGGRYDSILQEYVKNDLLVHHPDQLALLIEAGNTGQENQQQTLVGSALRTWNVYRIAQSQILQDVQAGNLANAQKLTRFQAEPTCADAISALRALIQLNQRLANSVHEAASVEEQYQLITTIIGAILAFLAITLVGWFISNTLVKRLKQLRQVTQAVEQGQLQERVDVVGRDEIADVSASVNAMLEAIVNLLQETRNQRDALTNAAEHLFSDMRVVSAGDLRINAPVTDDPIGMLANAFNFTVSRFRRFVLRVQTTIEQIDVISRQELERAEHFALVLAAQQGKGGVGKQADENVGAKEIAESEQPDVFELVAHLRQVRERLQKISIESMQQRTHTVQILSEQVTRTLAETARQQSNRADGMVQIPMRELRTIDQLLQRMRMELQNVQQNTAKHLIELDNTLTNFTHSLQKGKGRALIAPQASLAKEQVDLARLSTGFATEVGTLARKLGMLSQEMRAGIVAFQLDVPEHVGGSNPTSQSGIGPIGQAGNASKKTANYALPNGALSSEQRSNAASPWPLHTTRPLL
jgi:methyl-accepting chemotaxis protein